MLVLVLVLSRAAPHRAELMLSQPEREKRSCCHRHACCKGGQGRLFGKKTKKQPEPLSAQQLLGGDLAVSFSHSPTRQLHYGYFNQDVWVF